MLRHDNLLFLDEPTNHLDLESREILEEALDGYEGTLICVSHDRYFINRLASTVLYFENGEVKKCEGGYDEYIENRILPETVTVKKENSENKNLYLKKKQDAANLRKLKTAFSKCEQEIEKTEQELSAINEQLSDPDVSADYVKVSELTNKAADLEVALENLMTEWETLGAELEECQ
jgi:ATP-binding cassette subfamily F protein 3